MPGKLPTEKEVLSYAKKLSNWGRWGTDDELGTLNLITPAKRLQAHKLVKEGVTVSCGRLFERGFAADTGQPPLHFMKSSGERWVGVKYQPGVAQSSGDSFMIDLHGTGLTHLDAIVHFFWEGMSYNNRPANVVTTHMGALKSGIQTMRNGIVSRGLLYDFCTYKKKAWLEPGEVLYVKDLEAIEKAEGIKAEPGDILLYRTGYYRMRKETGPLTLEEGRPGFHPEVLPWMRERGIAVCGGDGASDVFPGVFKAVPMPFHQIGIPMMGLILLDNANLEELGAACASRKRWEFCLTFAPLPIVNATSSPVNPIAEF